MLRSALAILAGIATLTGASFAIEALVNPFMMRMFPRALPNDAAIHYNLWASLFSFAYQAVCVAAGGYVTAWLARRSVVRHAVIMGAIQAALVIPAMLDFRDRAPLRSWLIGMALIVPAAWAGGEIRARKKDQETGLAPALNSGVHGPSI